MQRSATGWEEGFFSPVAPPVSQLVAMADGGLVVAGTFTTMEDVFVSGIASWDGERWSDMGGGLPLAGNGELPRGTIGTLSVGPDGSVYAGGEFETIGGVAATNIARWNGQAWATLGQGLPYNITALGVAGDGSVYTTSCRHRPREPSRGSGVMRWDGSSWTRLVGSPDCVERLAVGHGGEVFATWGIDAYRWNPATLQWQLITGRPSGLWVDHIEITAAGTLYSAAVEPGEGHRLIRLGHDGWEVLEDQAGPWIRDLHTGADGHTYAATTDDPAIVSTPAQIRRWANGQWEIIEDQLHGPVLTLSVTADGTVYAGGRFTSEVHDVENLARLVDGQWELVHRRGGGADRRLMQARRAPDGQVYVAGDFERLGSVHARRVARWDGETWSPLGEGIDGIIFGLAVDASGALFVSGLLRETGDSQTAATHNVQVWKGDAWHVLPSLYCKNDPALGLAVARALAHDEHNVLYAGGQCTPGGHNVGFVARLIGGAWEWLAELETEPRSYGSEVHTIIWGNDGRLYVGGSFDRVGDVDAQNIAQWAGDRWLPVGAGTSRDDGLRGSIFDMLWRDGRLYVGGMFHRASSEVVRFVAAWNGQHWEPLADGFSAGVFALGVGPDAALYAGGDFDWAGTVRTSGIARWDGTSWHPLDQGVLHGRTVRAIAVDRQDKLLVGGEFSRAGDFVAHHVVRWSAAESALPPQETPGGIGLAIFPNPARSRAQLEVQVETSGRFRLALYDLAGRRIQVLHNDFLAAGPAHVFSIETAGFAAGIYVVSASGDGAAVQQALVIVR
jgi:trimeric autotransporter adhesin